MTGFPLNPFLFNKEKFEQHVHEQYVGKPWENGAERKGKITKKLLPRFWPNSTSETHDNDYTPIKFRFINT